MREDLQKACTYNIECKDSNFHKNIMMVSFNTPLIINYLVETVSLMKCDKVSTLRILKRGQSQWVNVCAPLEY